MPNDIGAPKLGVVLNAKRSVSWPNNRHAIWRNCCEGISKLVKYQQGSRRAGPGRPGSRRRCHWSRMIAAILARAYTGGRRNMVLWRVLCRRSQAGTKCTSFHFGCLGPARVSRTWRQGRQRRLDRLERLMENCASRFVIVIHAGSDAGQSRPSQPTWSQPWPRLGQSRPAFALPSTVESEQKRKEQSSHSVRASLLRIELGIDQGRALPILRIE